MNKNLHELECKGMCLLNIGGYVNVWDAVCGKCKGSKEERELIDKSFDSFNAREIIINKYDFNEDERDILHEEWY